MAVAIVYVKLSQHCKTDQKNSENFQRCTRLDNAQFTVDRIKELLFVKFRIAPPSLPLLLQTQFAITMQVFPYICLYTLTQVSFFW